MDQNTVNEGKTMAIISYLAFIGLIIAFIMNNSKKNEFTQFHIRQSIGLVGVSLINGFVLARFSSMASKVIGIGVLIFIILGIISAVKGEDKPLPILGAQFQDWFKGI